VPEGDTIFRTARTLHRALAGDAVLSFETVLPLLARVDHDTPVAGRTVDGVAAHGKWIEMRFSGGLILLTHMLMSGSWHIYRPGEEWQRSRYHMRIAVATEKMVAVAFNVQVAEFHTAESLGRRKGFKDLGPDLLARDFDEETAIVHLRDQAGLEVGPALLRQSLLAGIGNVFKNEICFAAGVNPFRKVGSLTAPELTALVTNARQMLMANVAGASGNLRQTRRRAQPFERLWVYGREGMACRRCGTRIEVRRQGEDARVTFWCPVCQPG
jgi:endonuclease VIII